MWLLTRRILLLSCFLFMSVSAVAGERTVLKIGGTGSSIGIMKILSQQYHIHHPDITIEVLKSLGSSGGIRALQAGAIDLAVASRPLKEKEKKDVHEYVLGTSPLVFAVHPETRVDSLTDSQLVDIYRGSLFAWPDGTQIRRILRPANDTDWLLMQTISPQLSQALEIASNTEGLYLAVTDTDAVSYLERVVGSFGVTTLAMVHAEQRQVKVLSYREIDPADPSSVARYHLRKTYHLVVRSEAPTTVTDFLTFIFSDQGKHVLSELGIAFTDE
jgi:phosphate transport system substrate-binding protein